MHACIPIEEEYARSKIAGDRQIAPRVWGRLRARVGVWGRLRARVGVCGRLRARVGIWVGVVRVGVGSGLGFKGPFVSHTYRIRMLSQSQVAHQHVHMYTYMYTCMYTYMCTCSYRSLR